MICSFSWNLKEKKFHKKLQIIIDTLNSTARVDKILERKLVWVCYCSRILNFLRTWYSF